MHPRRFVNLRVVLSRRDTRRLTQGYRPEQLVGDMEELFSRTAGPGVEIETKLAGNLWPVLCDPNHLENAMLNLVINARDAMPTGVAC